MSAYSRKPNVPSIAQMLDLDTASLLTDKTLVRVGINEEEIQATFKRLGLCKHGNHENCGQCRREKEQSRV